MKALSMVTDGYLCWIATNIQHRRPSATTDGRLGNHRQPLMLMWAPSAIPGVHVGSYRYPLVPIATTVHNHRFSCRQTSVTIGAHIGNHQYPLVLTSATTDNHECTYRQALVTVGNLRGPSVVTTGKNRENHLVPRKLLE